jgi:hypothetical protein
MSNRVSHQDLVKRVLDAKAVDFAAISKVVAEVGPTLSLADEPWETFCGTMRTFIRVFVLNPHAGGAVEELGGLRAAAGEMKG